MSALPGRVMLVGEQPPHRWRVDVDYRSTYSPMFPHPASSPGARLRGISGYSMTEFVYGLERVNLIHEWTEKWDAQRAIYGAQALVRCHAPSVIICCGRRVASAFGFPPEDPLLVRTVSAVLGCDVVALPLHLGHHKYYDDPKVREWVRVEFERVRPIVIEWKERRIDMLRPAEDSSGADD